MTLSDLEGNPLPYLDTLGIQEHFLRFKKVHLETYRSRLEPEVEDSLRNASAAFELTAMGKDGRREDIYVHWKPRTGLDRDAEGNLMEHDGEQMYGVTTEGEVVMVQRFVFDPLIRPLSDLQLVKLPLVASAGLPMPAD